MFCYLVKGLVISFCIKKTMGLLLHRITQQPDFSLVSNFFKRLYLIRLDQPLLDGTTASTRQRLIPRLINAFQFLTFSPKCQNSQDFFKCLFLNKSQIWKRVRQKDFILIVVCNLDIYR